MWFTDAWLKENVLDKYMYGGGTLRDESSSNAAVKISSSR